MSTQFLVKKCKAKTPLGFEIGIEEGVYTVIGDEPELFLGEAPRENVYEIKHAEFQKLKQLNLAVMQP